MNGAAAGIAVDDAPAGYRANRDDQPDFAIRNRAGRIAHRGFCLAVGVAVIMANHLLPPAARLPMRPQQRGRFDFKTARRIGRNIAGRHCRSNQPGHAEQQAAAFAGTGPGSFGQQGFTYPACNFHDHADIE